MVFRFDILSEDGFGRLCSLFNKSLNLKVRTPMGIVPITDFLLGNQSYRNIVRDPNIILKISNPTQEVPEELKDHLTFYNPNTTYYSSDLQPEKYIPDDLAENITCFFSKRCPSNFLNEEFMIEWYTTYFNEILQEIIKNPDKIKVLEGFGVSLNLKNIKNFEVLQEKLITFLRNPLVYDNIVALEFDGLFDSKKDYTSSVAFFLAIKNSIPADVLLILSGKILPYEYAFLSYLGFDAIDLTYLLYSGYSGLYYQHEEKMDWVRNLHTTDDIACACSFCQEIITRYTNTQILFNIKDESSNFSLLALHNAQMGLIEINRLRKNLKDGSLSTYMELQSGHSLFLITAIRHLHTHYLKDLLENQTLNKEVYLPCISPLTYYNSNVQKFSQTLVNNVEPNPNTKICIVLPCSMVKPYSKSKSHQKFKRIIRNTVKKFNKNVSEIILTSPLGLVPRELEEVFPAAHYDISVTGEWDNEEILLTAKAVENWLRKLPKNVIIITYLHGGYAEAFNIGLQEVLWENGTDFKCLFPQTLEQLEQDLQDSIASFDLNQETNRIEPSLSKEEQAIKMIADFQFGSGAGTKLIGNAARFIQSRNEIFKTILGFESYGKLQLGRYMRNSGRIQLNYQGGERLKDHLGITVTLNTLDILGTTIFKPGIEKVDEGLCSGDEVILLGPNKEYLGVGSMIVNSISVPRMRRGAVVKVRKMKKEK